MQLKFDAKFEVLSFFDGFPKLNIVGNKVEGRIIDEDSSTYGLSRFTATEYATLTGILSGKPSPFSSRPEEFGLLNSPGGFIIHGQGEDQIEGYFDGTGVINFLSLAEHISGNIVIQGGKNWFEGACGSGRLEGSLRYNPLTQNSKGLVIIQAIFRIPVNSESFNLCQFKKS